MNKDFYEQKLVLEDHLLHTDTYRKVADNADKITFDNMIKLVHKHSDCLTNAEKEYVKDPN